MSSIKHTLKPKQTLRGKQSELRMRRQRDDVLGRRRNVNERLSNKQRMRERGDVKRPQPQREGKRLLLRLSQNNNRRMIQLQPLVMSLATNRVNSHLLTMNNR